MISYFHFADEFEKLAKQQASKTQAAPKRGGEGSRGGKVVGRTKSGKPIYARKVKPGARARNKRNRKRDMRHIKETAAAVGVGGILAASILASGLRRGRTTLRFDPRTTRSSGGASRRARSEYQSRYAERQERARKARDRFRKASEDYRGAGGAGSTNRGRKASKAQWDEFKNDSIRVQLYKEKI